MSELDLERPESYPRRILLAVTGLSPQVVTETLFALAVKPQSGQPFLPTEVHLITTARGAEQARLYLLSEDPGWFHRLCRDYGLSGIRFDADHLHVLKNARGQPLEDIQTPEDNAIAADFIAEIVRGLASDPNAALHVSLAGGRKTMGYYLGYALSLYGRPQDRLSHVLVSPDFESHPQFYYPTPYERVILPLDHRQLALDCHKAQVWLADIPFVRLREDMPTRLLAGQAKFTEAVAAANRAHQPPRLVIDLAKQCASADGVPLDLTLTELALLLWLAEHACSENPSVTWGQPSEAEEFLAVAARVMNPMSSEYERCEKALRERLTDADLLVDYFRPHRSRMEKSIVMALGEFAARRYRIQRSGPRNKGYYYLPLEPEQIEVIG